ncbi:hypothetical protein [Roseobacter sp.]|uniref:hypothetical protein n=1 Tax=Roseobacter sp. TaxID=1907202 RepID=UPI00329687B2
MFRLFNQYKLLTLKLIYPRFTGFDDCSAARINDPVQKLFNLAINTADLRMQRILGAMSLRQAHVPCSCEHGFGQTKKMLGGL